MHFIQIYWTTIRHLYVYSNVLQKRFTDSLAIDYNTNRPDDIEINNNVMKYRDLLLARLHIV